jgi:dynein light intermediate chain 1
MEEIMIAWREKKRGPSATEAGAGSAADGDVTIPLGPGEWDAGLGLPLCVVCHNVSIACSYREARLT